MTNEYLLGDVILGHLLCVYLGFYEQFEGIRYIFIQTTDPIASSIPGKLKLNGICNIEIALGIETAELLRSLKHQKESYVEALRPMSSASYSFSKEKEEIQLLEELIPKYKTMRTPVEPADLEKIRKIEEIYDTLVYVISFNEEQYEKLKQFIETYNDLYSKKELEGQQNYVLPYIYSNEFLSHINNPQYIQMFGKNNLSLTNEKIGFFCHSLMYLMLNKQINIRKIIINRQTVQANFDNLTPILQPEIAEEPQDTNLKPYWQENFQWDQNKKVFKFGDFGEIDFEDGQPKTLFSRLVDRKGDWLLTKELGKHFEPASYLRATVSKLNKHLLNDVNKHVRIVSRSGDLSKFPKPLTSAYRLLCSDQPLVEDRDYAIKLLAPRNKES